MDTQTHVEMKEAEVYADILTTSMYSKLEELVEEFKKQAQEYKQKYEDLMMTREQSTTVSV